MVESRRPVFASSNLGLGLVAGGVTELIIIVGIGIDWHDESTCCVYNGPESAELVEGLCSVRKLGSSGAARESRRFLCTPMTFGGTEVDSRRELLWLESPEPLREPFRVVDASAETETFGTS